MHPWPRDTNETEFSMCLLYHATHKVYVEGIHSPNREVQEAYQ